MADRLGSGGAYGYLAYVDGRPAGWVNASMRSDYTLYRSVEGSPAEATIGVSCFVIAPPYREHGVAGALLDRVIADAAGRGASWVEGYPFNPELERPVSFRGSRRMFEQRGFMEVQRRERDTVMRRRVS
jgi:GNAT superfamily N-acetyltransferase